jgi:putative ABC transport system substrate-binding protein
VIDRRKFLAGTGAVLLAAPLAAEAQPAGKVRQIGYVDHGSAADQRLYLDAFRQGLRELGWVEGQNIALEVRFAEGNADRLAALAADLVRRKVDVIATTTTPAALAAKQVTATIPIVIGLAADPVGSGIVASLAHPGGNVTGWTHLGIELRAKHLELLKEAVPRVRRVGVFWNPANPVHAPGLRTIEAAAGQLKVELDPMGVQDPKEIKSAFSTLVAKRVEAIVVFPDGMFRSQTPLFVTLAAQERLPAMYGFRDYVEAGGLMAYGANIPEMYRRGAAIVDKILKGAKPANLPVEQPTKFDLVINLKTAKALGLTIPPSLLQRADEVIQ